MRCPRCNCERPFPRPRCPQCDAVYDAAQLEQLMHLDHLRERLEEWSSWGFLSPAGVEMTLDIVRKGIADLAETLGFEPAALKEEAHVPLEPQAPEPSRPEIEEALTGAPEPAPPPPPQVAMPKPPEVTKPLFRWKDVGLYLLSERTLNALLGLGAFLILASSTMISIFNPTHLTPLFHLGAVMATMMGFYGLGYFVRQKLALVRTGDVLLAIGGAFIPLTMWTLGQEQILDWETGAIWLAASSVCLPAYLACHAVLRDRPFALLTVAAAFSEALAVSNWLGLPFEWGLVGASAVGIACLIQSHRLKADWPLLSWALFWASQIGNAAIMIALLVARFSPEVWTATAGRTPDPLFNYAAAASWWLGMLFYGLSARIFQKRRYQFLTAWILPVSFLLTLALTPLKVDWHNLCLAFLAAGCIAYGRWRDRSGWASKDVASMLLEPVYQVGLSLTLVSVLWPFQIEDSRIFTLHVVSATYAFAGWFFRLVELRYVAAYLFPVAVGFSLDRLGSLGLDWFARSQHNVGYALLALAYVLVARLTDSLDSQSERHRAEFRPSLQVVYLLTVVAIAWPLQSVASAMVTIYALSLVYALATYLFRQRAYAFLSVYLLPAAYALSLGHLELQRESWPLAWAIFGGVLIASAELVVRLAGEERRPLRETVFGLGEWRSHFGPPLFSAGYAVITWATILSLASYFSAPAYAGARELDNRSVVAFIIIIVALAVSAVMRRSNLFLYPAVWLVLAPFASVALQIYRQLGLPFMEHELARLIASLNVVYFAVAYLVDRYPPNYARPIYLAAYLLSVATIFLSSLDRSTNVQVVGLSFLEYLWSAWLVHRDRHHTFESVVRRFCGDTAAAGYRAARAFFLHPASWLLPVWIILAMSLWDPAPKLVHYGIALALLAPVCVAIGIALSRIRWEYRIPWYVTGYGLSAVGPMVASPELVYRTWALSISVALYAASSRLFRRGEWLYPVAVLLPVVLSQLWQQFAIPPRLFGLGLVGLSLTYVVLGTLLHHGRVTRLLQPIRSKIGQFSLPFFAVGYLLSAFGLALIANQASGLVVLGFTLAALEYAVSALVFRQAIFSYLVAGTLAVAYVVAMTMTTLDPRYYGLGLFPGIVAYLVVAEVLRRRLDADLARLRDWLRIGTDSWSIAFYVVLHAGTAAMILWSQGDEWTRAIGWWAAASIYAVSVLLFRLPLWLHPTIGAALVAYLSTLSNLATERTLAGAGVSLIAPCVLLLSLSYVIVRLRGGLLLPCAWPSFGSSRALFDRWSRPLVVWGTPLLVMSAVFSWTATVPGLETAIAYFLLLTALGFLLEVA